MMAAIRGGDIETLRSLLHAGHQMIEAIMKIHTTSSTVTFVCGDVAIIGNGEFRASSGKVDGFILYADTLRYENGAKLSRDEQENLKCLYQHFVLNREDFIDWDI